MKMLDDLLATLPQRGRVDWIGLRVSRAAPMTVVEAAKAEIGRGLIGDRFGLRLDEAVHRPETPDPNAARTSLVGPCR